MVVTEPGTILVVGGEAILGAAVVASLAASGRRVIATSHRRGPAPPRPGGRCRHLADPGGSHGRLHLRRGHLDR